MHLEGCRSSLCIKVIWWGAKMCNPYSRNVKLWLATAVKFMCRIGFSGYDRSNGVVAILCHMTKNTHVCGWHALDEKSVLWLFLSKASAAGRKMESPVIGAVRYVSSQSLTLLVWFFNEDVKGFPLRYSLRFHMNIAIFASSSVLRLPVQMDYT